MTETFINTTFSNFVTLQRGFDLPKQDREIGKFPVVASTSVQDYHIEYKIKPPGVVTGRSGSLGSVQYIRKPFWPLNTTLWVKDFKGNSPKFVYYFLQTFGLERYNSGAGVPTLNRNHLGGLYVAIPSLPTQHKIAAILSAYDDLIENNLRRIKILEEMAQNLYREWFVKFRFPGYQHTRFTDSPLGRIPKGWDVKSLGELAVNLDRLRKPLSSIQRAELKGIYPYYGAAKVFDYIDSYIFDGIYLLVAEDGSVVTTDRKPVLQYVSGKFWPNNHTHILQGKGSVSTEFLYIVLSEIDITGYITGAAQPKITQANLNRIPVVVATDRILQTFNVFISDVFRQKIVLREKNEALRRTRDLLLPRLVSCELDVSELGIVVYEETVI